MLAKTNVEDVAYIQVYGYKFGIDNDRKHTEVLRLTSIIAVMDALYAPHTHPVKKGINTYIKADSGEYLVEDKYEDVCQFLGFPICLNHE